MKHLTALAILLATTSLASAASNESFILQAGSKNTAKVGQIAGDNTQATIQSGKKNSSVTAQQNDGNGPNKSATVEFGNNNTSQAGQIGGNNGQATLQIGNGNTATVAAFDAAHLGFYRRARRFAQHA